MPIRSLNRFARAARPAAGRRISVERGGETPPRTYNLCGKSCSTSSDYALRSFAASVPPRTESRPETRHYPDRGVQIAARWGEPLERVVGSRGIRSFVDADSESLLLGVPVHVLLADEVVLGRPCRVLYSFLNNGLVEYAVHFDRNEDSGRLHAEIKRELGLRYRGYRGELFPNCEDVFVDETGDTLLLLLRHEGVVLYFADMKACARFRAAEREREGRR